MQTNKLTCLSADHKQLRHQIVSIYLASLISENSKEKRKRDARRQRTGHRAWRCVHYAQVLLISSPLRMVFVYVVICAHYLYLLHRLKYSLIMWRHTAVAAPSWVPTYNRLSICYLMGCDSNSHKRSGLTFLYDTALLNAAFWSHSNELHSWFYILQSCISV